jgi:hypothetical protein
MIHSITHNLFLQYAKPEMKILELGDQLMDIGEETQFQRSDEFYKSIGLNIATVDIHGKNRAIAIDLSKESNAVFNVDLLTDFGTVEHVFNLYNALLNCHNWTKESGLMIHANPKTGTYKGHGVSFFTMEFWEQLALACNYHLLEVGEKSPYSEENPDKEVIAVLRKLNSDPFIAKEVFQQIADKYVFSE